MQNLKGSDEGVCTSESLDFWTLSTVRNSGYVSVFRRGQKETPTLLDPLERANLNHWWICFRFQTKGGDIYSVGTPKKDLTSITVIKVSSFLGTDKSKCPSPLTLGRNRSNFQNAVFSHI
jgi:hypothetical protein